MARRGPAPKPSALKLVRGVQKDRINSSEPIPPPGKAAAPPWLKGAPLREWKRLAPIGLALGTLTPADEDRFAHGCVASAHFQEALTLVTRDGLLGEGQKGAAVPSAALNVLERAETRFDRFCARFGFDPSSRSQLKVGDGKPKADDLLSG